MPTTIPVEQKQTFFMNEAYEESLKGRFLSPPNPWVGCVIVKHGEIIAKGHHKGPGTPHAEVMAIDDAKEATQGATAYITLEPCPNSEKAPSCIDALVDAGIKKVVIGVLDPNPNVRGKGIAKLQQAGIEVEVGVLEEKVKASMLPYCHYQETGRPFCILKAAISMDGKIAAKDGSSIWITGKAARDDLHQMRAQSQAILIGTKTALVDQPHLTVRNFEVNTFNPPLRVVIDAKGKLEANGPLFDTSIASTLIVTSKDSSLERRKEWENAGCEVLEIPYNTKMTGLDLGKLFDVLGKRGVLQLLAEGGSKLFSSLIEEKLVDRLVLYMGSCLLGAEGISLFSKLRLENIDDAIHLHLKNFTPLGRDIRLDYTF